MRGALLAASTATADHPAAPAYRWIFTHKLENAWWDIERYGVTHGDDMALLWQWADYPRSPNDEMLSYMLSRYVTNFAKSGNPNEAGLPDWPLFTPDRQKYLEVRVPSQVRERYPRRGV
jgi:para-nitrobenzyl esterase